MSFPNQFDVTLNLLLSFGFDDALPTGRALRSLFATYASRPLTAAKPSWASNALNCVQDWGFGCYRHSSNTYDRGECEREEQKTEEWSQ